MPRSPVTSSLTARSSASSSERIEPANLMRMPSISMLTASAAFGASFSRLSSRRRPAAVCAPAGAASAAATTMNAAVLRTRVLMLASLMTSLLHRPMRLLPHVPQLRAGQAQRVDQLLLRQEPRVLDERRRPARRAHRFECEAAARAVPARQGLRGRALLPPPRHGRELRDPFLPRDVRQIADSGTYNLTPGLHPVRRGLQHAPLFPARGRAFGLPRVL